MRAVRMHGIGGHDVLRIDEIPVPEPSAGEVLIKVEAAGVTFGDIMKRRGAFGSTDLPSGLGLEVAGTIESVGSGAGLRRGTRVAAWVDHGYAEYAVAAAAAVIPIPDTVESLAAAAIPVHGVTAYQTLTVAGGLRAGQTVLVHAAAGGVGTLAVQLARILGAGTVIGAASSRARLDHIRALGADAAIDYSRPGWSRKVVEFTGGTGVDIVLDSVGGDVATESAECLAPFATIVSFGAAGGSPAQLPSTALMATNSSLVGYSLTGWLARPDQVGVAVEEVLRQVAAKELLVPIAATFGLEEASEAHAAIESRTVNGKVVLLP